MKNTLLLLVLSQLNLSILYSQKFSSPFHVLDFEEETIVLETESIAYTEKFVNVIFNEDGEISNLVAKTKDGYNDVIPASRIIGFRQKASDLGNFFVANSSGQHITKRERKDYESRKREYIIFEPIQLPSGETVLLQPLNLDFNKNCTIYFRTKSSRNELLVKSEMPMDWRQEIPFKSYWFVRKDSQEAILVSNKNYSKIFLKLFGDCSDLRQDYKLKKTKVKWEDFEKHVYYYNKACKIRVRP